MLIRCPECSTGFRLPEGAIGGEPEKVKCSNCNFVFQVADRDGAVLFDESGDRLPEDAQLDEASPSDTRTPYDRDEDSDVGPKYPDETNTQIGTGPSASLTDDSTADGEQAEEEEADAGSESEGDPGTDQPRQPAGHETSTESEAVERARVPGSSDAGGEDGPDPKETLMGRPVPAEAEGIDTDDETEDPRDTRLGTPKATATTDASDPERHTTERTSPPTPGKEVDDSEASADQTEDDESSDAGRDARKTSDPFPHAEGAPDRDPKETATNLGSGTPAATEGGPASVSSPGSGETETGDEEEEDDLDLFEDDEEASETAPSSAETESDGRSPTTDATDSEVGLHDESSPDETVDDVPFPEAEEPSDATGDSESDSDETTLAVGDVPQDDDSYLASGADDGDVAPAGVSGEGTDFAEETGEVDPEPEADESSPLEIDEEVGSDLADREPGGFSADAPETGVESSGIDPTPEPTSESGDSVTRTTPATGTSDIDPSPRARVAGDAFGPSGWQRAANLLLVVLLVANAFLAYVAVQNGGFIDFAKFRQMLSVAFQGGEYEPREEWTEPAPAPKVKAPQEPLSFENTVARTLELEGDSPKRLLVLSGRVKNETDETISNVEVRGLVFDKQGRRRAETTAPVGVYLSDQKLRSADSPEDLLPDAASPIEPHRSQPYTVIFTDPPDEVFEGGPVRYGVEVAGEK